MTGTNQAWRIISQFIGWQAYGFRVKECGDVCIIETPFFRADNEIVEIEVRFLDNGKMRFTDAGKTLAGLQKQGLKLNGQNLDRIHRVARLFCAELSYDDYTLAFDSAGGINYLQSVISASLAVSGLFASGLVGDVDGNAPEGVELDGKQGRAAGESLNEMFDRIRRENPEPEGYVPPPPDFAKNYKHYLYGFPKEE